MQPAASTINTTASPPGSTGFPYTTLFRSTIANLGAFSANGLTVNDTTGGLNVTGAVTGGTGLASITTTGGRIAASNNVTDLGVTLVGSSIDKVLGAAVNGQAATVALTAGG